jgi:hypothetical protein
MENAMKSVNKHVLCFFVCLLLVISIVMPVEAKASTTDGGTVVSQSGVTALTGDTTFTVTGLDQPVLPGTVQKGQTYLPLGYADELQFAGSGIQVAGVTYGTENACFGFDLYPYGWTGSVYQWTGTKWTKLETTVSDGGEGSPSACAVIHGNGIYALLIGLTNPIASSTGGGTPKSAGCGDSISLTSFTFDHVSYDFFYFAGTLTWAEDVDYIDFYASNSSAHLSAGSTGFMGPSGMEFPTTSYPTDSLPMMINIYQANILTGSTVDYEVTYVTSDSVSHTCNLSGIVIEPNAE